MDADLLSTLSEGVADTLEERFLVAVDVGDYETVEKYLSNPNLEVNTYNDTSHRDSRMHDWTAMHIAIAKHKFTVAKQILKHPEVRIDLVNVEGQTAIHFMALYDTYGVLANKLVGLVGAEIANMQDISGRTALHVACRSGNLAMTRALLAVDGIDPYVLDIDGKSPMTEAAKFCHPFVVDELLDHGVDSNMPKETPDVHRPIAYAIRGYHLPIVDNLIKHGAVMKAIIPIRLKIKIDGLTTMVEADFETPNMATTAVNSCLDWGVDSFAESISIAKKVVEACHDPPTDESVFKLYTRYVKVSPRGQNGFVISQIEAGGENEDGDEDMDTDDTDDDDNGDIDVVGIDDDDNGDINVVGIDDDDNGDINVVGIDDDEDDESDNGIPILNLTPEVKNNIMSLLYMCFGSHIDGDLCRFLKRKYRLTEKDDQKLLTPYREKSLMRLAAIASRRNLIEQFDAENVVVAILRLQQCMQLSRNLSRLLTLNWFLSN